jgi:hypothetical protein
LVKESYIRMPFSTLRKRRARLTNPTPKIQGVE